LAAKLSDDKVLMDVDSAVPVSVAKRLAVKLLAVRAWAATADKLSAAVAVSVVLAWLVAADSAVRPLAVPVMVPVVPAWAVPVVAVAVVLDLRPSAAVAVSPVPAWDDRVVAVLVWAVREQVAKVVVGRA
jgi:hypothetical protein